MKFTTSTCGREQVKVGILQVKVGMRSRLSLALCFCIIHRLYPTAHHYKTSRLSLATATESPDFDLHQFLDHPSTIPHLSSLQNVPTFTCISFCIIPRLYPTTHHYKTSRLSLATVDRPPLLSVFIIKHNKSLYSARLSVAIMSFDSPLRGFHY